MNGLAIGRVGALAIAHLCGTLNTPTTMFDTPFPCSENRSKKQKMSGTEKVRHRCVPPPLSLPADISLQASAHLSRLQICIVGSGNWGSAIARIAGANAAVS
jgi:hypothetical protein